MCGLAGILGNVENKEIAMQHMLKIQNHRGPDAKAIWQDDNIILGHNRLSIIDLHQSANQPMHDIDARYVIIFNGEIYNYKEIKEQLISEYNFKTQSDTEVILAAYNKWGKDCLHHLNGMFSFAIWNKNTHELFIARDRFGVKPLYYSIWQGTLFFCV